MVVLTRRAPAAEPIRAIVRSFGERRALLGGEIVTTPLPARPDQFIEIYLADPYRVSHDGAPAAFAPEMVVVGPQSYRRTRLFMSGEIKAFTIRFELSNRQFTRRFAAQIGLPPKLYARTTRFNAVLDAKEASPHASWTESVHAAGYADQAHFIRDSHALAGAAPAGFFAEWSERQAYG